MSSSSGNSKATSLQIPQEMHFGPTRKIDFHEFQSRMNAAVQSCKVDAPQGDMIEGPIARS